MLTCFSEKTKNAIPITALTTDEFPHWQEQQSVTVKNWLLANDFTGKADSHCLLSDKNGHLERVAVGIKTSDDAWCYAGLANQLPPGDYYLDGGIDADLLQRIAIVWGLQHYQFGRYKQQQALNTKLLLPETLAQQEIKNIISAIFLIRDLINTPTEHMGPAQLAEACENVAKAHQAEFQQILGEQLLQDNYPAIHAVGRASVHAPRLLELRWGDKKHPKLTLIGKGVCFDSGGLDLKPSSGMRLMKKDMGGAAHVLGLAQLIMAQKLKIQLRVLIPAVENAVSGNAYRPGDVIATRKGLTVEIGNTDAEGRMVLADAIAAACEEDTDLIIDFATLTGAARVALGTDIPVMFCNQDALAQQLSDSATTVSDPMWRLPLYQPYEQLIESNIADMNNAASSGYGGAITAALFLQKFVKADTPWVHLDLMAWNLTSKPGRPEGGEAMALRSVYHYLKTHFTKAPKAAG